MPDSWFSEVVEALGIPIITTSVNSTGQPYAVNVKTIDEKIKKAVDLIIDDRTINGTPSKIVNLTLAKPKITKRAKNPKKGRVILYTRGEGNNYPNNKE